MTSIKNWVTRGPFLFLAIAAFGGCGKDDPAIPSFAIPDVTVGCLQSAGEVCEMVASVEAGLKYFIYWSQSNCTLDQLNKETADAYAAVGLSVMSDADCDGTTCSETVSTWFAPGVTPDVDGLTNSVKVLPQGVYTLCALIDKDGDGTLSSAVDAISIQLKTLLNRATGSPQELSSFIALP